MIGAALLGSLASATVSGCKPPETPTVDVSADAIKDTDSNTTLPDGNVTGHAPSIVDSPTGELADEIDRASDTSSRVETSPPVRGAATKLVATTSKEIEAVMSAGGDWPQWGGTSHRNNVPNVKNLPTTWNIGRFDRKTGEWDQTEAENVLWFARLGSQTYGNPVVADGRVFVGTNNGAGHLKRYPSKTDLGCLLAFDEKTGELLWQHSSEKLSTGRVHDWPLQGICDAPLVEGERLWFVTSRGEVLCLDTLGFHDEEDDGEVQGEAARIIDIMNAGPSADLHAETLAALGDGKLPDAVKEQLAAAGEAVDGGVSVNTVNEGKVWSVAGKFAGVQRELTVKQLSSGIRFFKSLGVHDKQEADTIWAFDMMKELKISQHNMCSCSVTIHGDLLFVATGNGLDETHIDLPSPDAPSFICMNKNTGEVLWTDASPATNILHGQWSSPAVAEFDGVLQVLFAGGDGWLYSFAADGGRDGKPELLWKFDCNPKETKWVIGGEGTRNNLIATPVAYQGRVYIAVGQDPEHGEGEGHLWCIDPTKRGDVSPQLAMKDEGGKRTPIAHRRIQAVNTDDGEVAVDNPNSAVVWHYSMLDSNDDGEIDFEEEMHRSCGTVAIKDDVLYVADFSGLVHCLDANGSHDGQPILHFTYDMLAQSWGSPLIADGHVYVGDEDGDVCVFEFGAKNAEPIEEINMGSSVYSTPVAANDTIFISTKDKLFAIGKTE